MGFRYIGNKARLLDWILQHVREAVPPGATVADPMCGTATVSAGLRERGFKVIAADIMTYSYHHARVRLGLSGPPSFEGLELGGYPQVLDRLNTLPPLHGLFFQEYSPAGQPAEGCSPRRYFSAENAGRIDAIRDELRMWEEERRINPLEGSLLKHDLVLATNRVANIAGTYGHHRSKWNAGARRSLELRPYVFDEGRTEGHRVLQGRVEDLAPNIKADLCYLDPPYMKRQYAANYHILETLARGDSPVAVGVSGLRDWWDQHSSFCRKTEVWASLATVINTMRCPNFLISYSEDGLVSISDLTAFLEQFGTVSLDTKSIGRFRSNGSSKGSVVRECLLHLERD